MKHKISSLTKSVIIASALLIPLFSSAENCVFTVTQNSAKALSGTFTYYRAVGLCGNYVVGVSQCETGNASTAVMININTGAVTTANGGSWGGTDFAIGSDDNGILGYMKWYPIKKTDGKNTAYAPWRFIYKWDCSGGTNGVGGDPITIGNEHYVNGYSTLITDDDTYRAQAMRINGNINGDGSIWYLPRGADFVWEIVTSGGQYSTINKYTLSGAASGYTNGEFATAYRYDTNRLFICSANYLYDCSVSGTTATVTNATPSGVNKVNLLGSMMFTMQGHKFLVRSNSSTEGSSSFGVYDVTSGFPGTAVQTFTPFSGTCTTYGINMWVNIKKVSATETTIVIYYRGLGVAKYTMKPKCSTPTANVNGGTYTSHQHVTLSCATSGATIRYTTNGSEPTSSSTAYSGAINVTSNTRIRAKAFKSGFEASDEFDQTYTINATLAAPTFSVASGTQFSSSGSVTITAPSGSTLHYSTDGGSSYTTASGNTATVTITEATTLKAYATQTDKTESSIATASYTVKCATPTASINGGTYTSHQHITLSCTTSDATIRYTTNGSEPTSSSTAYSGTIDVTSTTRIRAKAFKANCVASDEFDQTYTIDATLASPTFSPATGTQFTTSGSVTITAPSGAKLRYSTDGGTTYTTVSSGTTTVYVLQATTLKAYATQTDKTDSPVATASYTVKCATPTITPATGTYPKEQTVNIACATPGATIYYTLDGSTPTTSSPVYSAPFTVNDDPDPNTQYLVPIYGIKADQYEKNEHIIPASSMSGLGASASNAVFLNSLTWYLSSPALGSFGAARFKVFLKEVSGTSLGGTFSGPEGGTVVYEGELDATQPTLTVNFSTPYEYHGGNLLVGVYTTTPGNSVRPVFYGTEGVSGCSGYDYNSSSLDNITTPQPAYDFLPKTTFTYTTDPIIVSKTTTVKALAVMSGCVNSDVASETITITPQSQPVASSSINVAYSPVIGTSTNNPDRDLARIDATITFNRPNTSDGTTFPAYPTTFSDYYLDHYVVTVYSGSGYAKAEGGADFLSVSIDAKSGAGAANTVSLNARDLKLGQQTEVCVTACYVYQPTSADAQSSQTTKSFSGYTYETYSPSISAKLFLFQNQEYKVWWESEHTSVTRYADVYRVEIQINDAMSTSAIPVSYYQLQMRRSPSAEWENIVDRTINNLCYGDSIEAHTTYPTGFGLAAGRFPGNYNFISHQYTADIGTEEEWDINLEYYYAFDVTPPAQSAPHQPLGHIRNYEGNEDPTKWQFRIVAVYGGSDSVTVDGTPVTPTTDNISESTEDVFIQHNDPIITGVDSVKGDVNLKEVQYYDLRGVRLNEAPSTGFYIEVRLYDNGQVVTSKRLAR